MTVVDAVLIAVVGVAAGTINAVVGSGSLITFPTLLALGYPPVVANISNNIGLVSGGLAGTWGYRSHLSDQKRRLVTMAIMSAIGGASGALLLLALPASAFATVVPVLIAIALVLVVAQPVIQRTLAARRRTAVHAGGPSPLEADEREPGKAAIGASMAAAGIAGVYGGYFGGAQGILLVGMLGLVLPETLQRLNALKNGLTTCVNAVAAVVFVVVAPWQVDWMVVLLLAAGSTVGGLLGARVGKRLSPTLLRAMIVVVGVVAIISLL
ncbi:sulfite exporter TauE/SafE family protein [Pseudonocardia sp. TRM90224]|uniref:sulfite exporter TauE/SafE family protein n=1 Tax=Pseudonocardia sp. TRM90224 TaxID=2812678 RepID=UPI001E4016E6|nr:sulfite exporter TauE/SafE family protein [Pseudonocardia sp. TRM90224]